MGDNAAEATIHKEKSTSQCLSGNTEVSEKKRNVFSVTMKGANTSL